MITGLYSATSSMMNGQREMEVLSSNLANITVPGHKKDQLTYRPFSEFLSETTGSMKTDAKREQLGGGAMAENMVTCFEPGQMTRTGNNSDLAISGHGFFKVETEQGIRYTRNGSFTQNASGHLITSTGGLLLNPGDRPIRIGNVNFKVRSDGDVTVEERENGVLVERVVGRIALVDFPERQELIRCGNSEFKLPEGSQTDVVEAEGRITQGFLELSNMSLVDGMVRMIAASRSYEASQRILQTIDETINKSVNEIANPKS